MCRKNNIIKKHGLNVYMKVARVEGNFVYAYEMNNGRINTDYQVIVRKSQVDICTVCRIPVSEEQMDTLLQINTPFTIRHTLGKMWDKAMQERPDVLLFFSLNTKRTCYGKYMSVSRILIPLTDEQYKFSLSKRQENRMRYQLNGVQTLN